MFSTQADDPYHYCLFNHYDLYEITVSIYSGIIDLVVVSDSKETILLLIAAFSSLCHPYCLLLCWMKSIV
jgi:hypothetical protein